MPIDTSVITGTKAHKHSVDSSDGGFLESTVTGMTNLTVGGLIVGGAGNIQTNLPIGTGLQYVRANAGATALEYATLPAGGATVTKQNIAMAATFNTSSASYVDVTGVSVTIATRSGLMAFVTADFAWNCSAVNTRCYFQLLVDGVATGNYTFWTEDSSGYNSDPNYMNSISAVADSGEIVKLQCHASGAPDIYIFGTAANDGTKICALEVS